MKTRAVSLLVLVWLSVAQPSSDSASSAPSSLPGILARRSIVDAPSAVTVNARIGIINEWGFHPGAPLGVSIGLDVGSERWRGVFEPWVLLPNIAPDAALSGSLNVFSVGATAGGCYAHPLYSVSLSGCVLGRAGATLLEPRNLPDLERRWVPAVSAGARVGAEWPRDSLLALYISLHAFVPILRSSVSSATLSWAQSVVTGGGQFGFRVRFL